MRIRHGMCGWLGPLCIQQSSACFVVSSSAVPRKCSCCCTAAYIESGAGPNNRPSREGDDNITITIIVGWKLLFSPITAIICVCASPFPFNGLFYQPAASPFTHYGESKEHNHSITQALLRTEKPFFSYSIIHSLSHQQGFYVLVIMSNLQKESESAFRNTK